MQRLTSCFMLSAGLVILVPGIFTSAENATRATFEEDLLFWSLKYRTLMYHKTFAFYSRPRDLNSGNARLLANHLFGSQLNGEIWAMAADYHAKKLYYTDHVTNFIGVYDLKTREHRRLFKGMAWGIDGLAVDWVSGNVYWIDTNYNWIMVADRNFSNYRNLVQIESRIPAKIAVDPNNRYIYWSESRRENCRILRSDLHGFQRKVLLILLHVQSVVDITIDFVNNRLYWAESLKKVWEIGRVRYVNLATIGPDSTIHDVYVAKFAYLFSLASYKDHLYLTNIGGRKIIVLSKSERRVVAYNFNSTMVPRGITVYSGYEHPLARADEFHECQRAPCQHLCLAKLGKNQYDCECRIGFSLQADGKSCLSSMTTNDFALVIDGMHSKLYQMNLKYDLPPQEVVLSGVEMPAAAAYDWLTQRVFWADEKTRTISSSSIYGYNQTVLVQESQAKSIALDPASRNMYWLDSGKDAIYVSKMDGSYVHTLHLDRLHAVWGMAIDTFKGYLYWSDWGRLATNGGPAGAIMSSRLDGSDVKVITRPGMLPYGLALDPKNGILFWTQLLDHSIEWINLRNHTSGKYALPVAGFSPLRTRILSLIHISCWQDHLYLVSAYNKHVLRVAIWDVLHPSKAIVHARQVRPFGPNIFYQPTGIYAFDSALVKLRPASTVCANSSCPQLCLPHHIGHQVHPKCVCQDHFKFMASSNTCVRGTSENDTTPPTFSSTCPLSQLVVADECSEEAEVSFVEPKATDDSGLPVTVKHSIAVSQMPIRLKEGRHTFSYTAIDRSHNQAQCQFKIDIVVWRCPKIKKALKTIPRDAVLDKPSCGNIVGSIINVTCPGSSGVAYQYQCQANRAWTPHGLESCGPQVASREDDDLVNKTFIAGDKDTTFYSQPALPATRTEDAVMTSHPTSVGGVVAATTMSRKPRMIGTPERSSGSYSTKLVVGIVLAVITLVVLGIAFFVIYRRGKSELFTISTNWNRIDDRVQLTGTNAESGIYLEEADHDEDFVTIDGELRL